MARRILNRKDLRADFEAAERRKSEDEVEGDEEETEDDEEAAADSGEGDEAAEEEAPKKKKKAVKEAKPKRTRAVKHVRMKLVWGVFNNSNQRVATFDYPKRKEAEEHAAKLGAAKNPPQSFFIQPIKEPMEDEKG
jgi:hypothetical protein